MAPKIRAEFVLDNHRRPRFSDDGKFTHYHIRLWLEGASEDTTRVTYRLHESYREPLRDVGHGPLYEEEMTSCGDFTVKALLLQSRDFDVLSVGLLDALRETYGPSPDDDIRAALEVFASQGG